MATLEVDPAQHILAIHPGHQVWIDGVSQSCGLEKPSLAQPQGVLMDKWTRMWTFVWLEPQEEPGSGPKIRNYGVRITQQGRKFECTVRGPQGHASVEHWFWFPGPDVIISLAMLVGFDWA